MTTKIVERAIERSIRHDEIVKIEATAADMDDLRAECDAYVETDGVTEFWGESEEGEDWRVHAVEVYPVCGRANCEEL